MGFSLRRALTPPRRIRQIIRQVTPYLGVAGATVGFATGSVSGGQTLTGLARAAGRGLSLVPGAGGVIGGLFQRGLQSVQPILDAVQEGAQEAITGGQDIFAGISELERRTGAEGPPKPIPWAGIIAAAAAAWLLFSPNPGLLTALFAGPVRVTSRTSCRKRKSVTKVTVSKAPKRKASRKRKSTRRRKRRR